MASPAQTSPQTADTRLTSHGDTANRATDAEWTSTQTKLLGMYLLEKALYENVYELGSRPDWVSIPVGGLRRLLKRLELATDQ